MSSVRPSQIGFWMITCEQKVGLNLGVVCMCILWISRSISSLIMTIFWHFLPELFPFFSSPDQKARWAIAITWRLSWSVCKLFKKSSSLKPLNQFEPNLTTINLRVSSLKIVSDVPADQRTWLSLLKVEHGGNTNKKIQLKHPAIASKLCWNDTFVIPFKNYGWWPEPPSNMATTIIKKGKFDKFQ